MPTLNQLQTKNQYGEPSVQQIVPAADGSDFTFPSGVKLYSGTGVPSFSAPAGSMYLRADASTSSTCIYVNTALGNNWAAK